jgi:hypothetical protein
MGWLSEVRKAAEGAMEDIEEDEEEENAKSEAEERLAGQRGCDGATGQSLRAADESR